MSLPNVWQLSTKTGLPCNTGATMQCDSVANPAYDGYGDEQGRLDRWNRFTQWAQRMYQWIEAQKRLNSAFDPTVDEVRNEHNILCAICANPLGVRWPTTTIGVMGVQHNVPEAWAEGPMSIFRIGFVPPRADAGLSSRSRPAESGQGTCEYVHTGCLYGLMVNRGRYEGVTPFRFERMLTNENAIPYAGAIMERLIAEAQTVGMDIPPEVYEEVQEQVRFDAERRRNPAYQPPPMRIRFMDDDDGFDDGVDDFVDSLFDGQPEPNDDEFADIVDAATRGLRASDVVRLSAPAAPRDDVPRAPNNTDRDLRIRRAGNRDYYFVHPCPPAAPFVLNFVRPAARPLGNRNAETHIENTLFNTNSYIMFAEAMGTRPFPIVPGPAPEPLEMLPLLCGEGQSPNAVGYAVFYHPNLDALRTLIAIEKNTLAGMDASEDNAWPPELPFYHRFGIRMVQQRPILKLTDYEYLLSYTSGAGAGAFANEPPSYYQFEALMPITIVACQRIHEWFKYYQRNPLGDGVPDNAIGRFFNAFGHAQDQLAVSIQILRELVGANLYDVSLSRADCKIMNRMVPEGTAGPFERAFEETHATPFRMLYGDVLALQTGFVGTNGDTENTSKFSAEAMVALFQLGYNLNIDDMVTLAKNFDARMLLSAALFFNISETPEGDGVLRIINRSSGRPVVPRRMNAAIVFKCLTAVRLQLERFRIQYDPATLVPVFREELKHGSTAAAEFLVALRMCNLWTMPSDRQGSTMLPWFNFYDAEDLSSFDVVFNTGEDESAYRRNQSAPDTSLGLPYMLDGKWQLMLVDMLIELRGLRTRGDFDGTRRGRGQRLRWVHQQLRDQRRGPLLSFQDACQQLITTFEAWLPRMNEYGTRTSPRFVPITEDFYTSTPQSPSSGQQQQAFPSALERTESDDAFLDGMMTDALFDMAATTGTGASAAAAAAAAARAAAKKIFQTLTKAMAPKGRAALEALLKRMNIDFVREFYLALRKKKELDEALPKTRPKAGTSSSVVDEAFAQLAVGPSTSACVNRGKLSVEEQRLCDAAELADIAYDGVKKGWLPWLLGFLASLVDF